MLANLFRRRVPQILGLYLGACFALFEFVSMLTERYLLSDAIVDLTLITLLAMTPTVALIAWFHGTPGKDRWVTAEKVFVPANVLATAALLGILFHGEELGATTTTISAVDEHGQTVSRQAPKQGYRRRLALFFFDNAGADSEQDWLRYGVTAMLWRDLRQDPFVGEWMPLDGLEQSGMTGLQRAGYGDALDVPVPLMRQIASQRGMTHMLQGSFAESDGGFAIEARLHWVDGSREPEPIVVQGVNPMAAVDELSREVKGELELPRGADRLAPDLPTAEHFTASAAAARHYVRALVANSIDNDSERAIAEWRLATAEDPTFADAHLQMALRAFNAGKTDIAVPAVRNARQHDYKLLPDEKFHLKALNYFIDGRAEMVIPVYETWAQLYPDDVRAQRALAITYVYRANDLDKAATALERIRQIDPNEQWALHQLAHMKMLQGDDAAALDLLNEYVSAHPEDYKPLQSIAMLHRNAGRLDEARKHFDKSALLASGWVDPLLSLADLNLREGKYAAALARIADARRIAAAPRQESAVTRAEIDYFEHRGMLDEMVERLDALYEIDRQFRNPINLAMTSRINYVEHYIRAGKSEFVATELARLKDDLQPPMDELVQVGWLSYYLTLGDLEHGKPAVARVREVVTSFKRDDLQYLNDLADARIHELEGDLDQAVAAAETALEKYQNSVQSLQADADQIRLRIVLGNYRRMAGDLRGAEDILRDVLKIYPAAPLAHLALAEVARDRGDAMQARAHLQRALAAWDDARPDYEYLVDAQKLLAKLQ